MTDALISLRPAARCDGTPLRCRECGSLCHVYRPPGRAFDHFCRLCNTTRQHHPETRGLSVIAWAMGRAFGDERKGGA
jgi:hypothetical protein